MTINIHFINKTYPISIETDKKYSDSIIEDLLYNANHSDYLYILTETCKYVINKKEIRFIEII